MVLSKKASTLLFVILVILTILLFIPFVWAFLNSFKTNNEIFGGSFLPVKWTLNNYVYAWNRGHFDQYMLNSVIVSVTVVLAKVSLAVPAGYAFAKLRLRKYPILFYMFLLGMAVPVESFVIVLFFQLKDLNLVNSLWGIILPTVAVGIPFAVFMMRNFFMELPDSLIESAKIDGAGTLTIFTKIMLPLAKPGVLVIAVLGFLDAWNEYFISILVLISPEIRTIPIGIMAFFDENDSNYGAVFAGMMMSIIPSILVYASLQKTFISGLTMGGLKE
jgi:ABC-type glycerol-3-phosphate transport system permease component